jgi:hypothetical protein
VSVALLLLLALSPGLRTPDLQVEAGTSAGVELPELAEAVARALVASGARVLLGGPANEACPRCARVAVTDLGQGRCRVDVTQDARTASANLSLGGTSPLFDRARAIAIQARLLVRGEPVARPSESSGRPAPRKGPAKPEPDLPAEVGPALAGLSPAETRPAPESPREPVATAAGPLTQPSAAPPPAARRPTPPAAAPPPIPAPTLAEESPPVRRPTKEEKRQSPAREPEKATEDSLDDAVYIRKAEPTSARWPWIPLTIGVGAAVGASLCALVAQNRYESLADRSRPYDRAVALKQEGENWQVAAFIASGVAVAGLGVGIWGFATSKPTTNSLTPTVAVLPGGAMLAMTGGLP